jgi:hypothetical protein
MQVPRVNYRGGWERVKAICGSSGGIAPYALVATLVYGCGKVRGRADHGLCSCRITMPVRALG